jgi:hypothetical protein|tara:strand:- start:432 stop:695 length:264 start_codon:yes stop_codon:yes gene_type:complete
MGIVKKLITELRTEICDEEYLLLSHDTDEVIDEMSDVYSKEELTEQKYNREQHKGKIDGLKKAVFILGMYAKNNSYHSQKNINRHKK